MAEENRNFVVPHIANVTSRRPRTSEDFYLFCTYVLQYENYGSDQKEVAESRITTNPSPPLDSSGSSVNSESTHSGQDDNENEHDKPIIGSDDSDDTGESHDLVTCFCGKPFADRPMIECSKCLTWIHLSCARIKRNNIPDIFHCTVCKSDTMKKLRSGSLPHHMPEKGIKRPKRAT